MVEYPRSEFNEKEIQYITGETHNIPPMCVINSIIVFIIPFIYIGIICHLKAKFVDSQASLVYYTVGTNDYNTSLIDSYASTIMGLNCTLGIIGAVLFTGMILILLIIVEFHELSRRAYLMNVRQEILSGLATLE